MKIKVYQNLINSVYSVVVSNEDFDRGDLDAIVKYGEPEVDIGGIFLKHTPPCLCKFGQKTCCTVEDRVVGLLDGLDRLTAEELSSGDGVQESLLNLKQAASGCCIYTQEDVESCPECFFVMPASLKKVRSDFPVMVEFNSEVVPEGDDPKLIAGWWADEVVRRIACAMKTLRSRASAVVKEETYEI